MPAWNQAIGASLPSFEHSQISPITVVSAFGIVVTMLSIANVPMGTGICEGRRFAATGRVQVHSMIACRQSGNLDADDQAVLAHLSNRASNHGSRTIDDRGAKTVQKGGVDRSEITVRGTLIARE